MPRRHRSHSTEFKRQVVAEFQGGETLHALGRRHDLSRNLIRVWIEKAEAGALDEDVAAAEPMAEFGKWNTVFKRFRRWVKADAFYLMFKVLSDNGDFEYVMVDGTIVKVHRHGQGTKGGLRARPSGALAAV